MTNYIVRKALPPTSNTDIIFTIIMFITHRFIYSFNCDYLIKLLASVLFVLLKGIVMIK